MARRPPREGLVEEIGGIKIARRRPPMWLVILIVLVVSWGLFYLINYSITETGTFEAPQGVTAALGSFGP